jgi:RNA polymerase sigma-70 factor (ECF subfamily)
LGFVDCWSRKPQQAKVIEQIRLCVILEFESPQSGQTPSFEHGSKDIESMMTDSPTVENLMIRAKGGETAARHALLDVYQSDLRRMVEARLDRRIRARLDASDVVQDALVDAWRRMDAFLEERPLPLLAWLRQITHERIIDTHRHHVISKRRSPCREIARAQLPDESAAHVANRLLRDRTCPSTHLAQKELQVRIREAIISLPSKDRDVVLMRLVEEIDIAAIAAKLGITRGAVAARLFRAIRRLRAVLGSGD